jgi:hypothetical protein
MKRSWFAGVAVVIALSACGGQTDAQDDSLVSFTMVKLNADGTHEVREQLITRAEQRARVDAQLRAVAQNETGVGRAEEAITSGGTNGSCPANSIGLSDQSNYGGNYICLWGSGTAVLQNFCRIRDFVGRCTANWSVSTRSYISGNENGYFEDGQFNVSTFTHYNYVPTVGSVPYYSVILGLTE